MEAVDEAENEEEDKEEAEDPKEEDPDSWSSPDSRRLASASEAVKLFCV